MSTPLTALVSLPSSLPADAVFSLGERLTQLVSDVPLCPERVLIGDDNAFSVCEATVEPRWRAPEVRALAGPVPPTAELWSLGRLLLEVALGSAVADAVADDATDANLRELRTIEGEPLHGRLVEILAVLLNPKPAERLQSAKAAARVFADAEKKTEQDGNALLDAALAQARAGTALVLASGANGIGNPHQEPAPTIGLNVKDVLDKMELDKIAQQAEAERRRKQAVPVKKTEDLPAKAILSEMELERIAAATQAVPQKKITQPPSQKQLPTQIVPRDKAQPKTGDRAVDAEIVEPQQTEAPAPSPSPAQTTAELAADVVKQKNKPLWIAAAVGGAIVLLLLLAIAFKP